MKFNLRALFVSVGLVVLLAVVFGGAMVYASPNAQATATPSRTPRPTRTPNALWRLSDGTTTAYKVKVVEVDGITIDGVTPVPGGSKVIASVGDGVGVYRAMLVQSGSGDPTATVFENSLGYSVTYSRNSAGDYAVVSGSQAGVWVRAKTYLAVSGGGGVKRCAIGGYTGGANLSNNLLKVYDDAGSNQDGWECYIEIRVYP